MKMIGFIIAAVFWSSAAPAMSFWAALAEIESGGNDYAVGNVGEISRYQIRPEVWRVYSSSRRYADPAVALPVAKKYLAKLERDFERASGRPATEADCVILWKSGITGYEKRGFIPARMSAAHLDRITRFRNLRMEGTMLVQSPAQHPAAYSAVPGGQKQTNASVMENFFLGPAATNQFLQTGGWFTRIGASPDVIQSPTLCLR